MTKSNRQIVAVLLAVLTITAIAVGGAAGAIALDSETTDTSTQSDVTSSTTTVDLRPGNASESTYIEVTDAASENLTLIIKPEAADGTVVDYEVYRNESEDVTNASTNNVAWNITHDELEDAPRDVDGGNYRLLVVNDTDDEEEQLNQSFTFDHQGTDRTAVIHVADTAEATSALLADRVEISERFGYFGAEKYWSDNGSTVSAWSAYTTVNGTNTSVEVHAVNDSTADAYTEAAETYENKDWIRTSTLWVNGIPVKVYKNEAPDDAPDDATYAVYDVDTEVLTVTHQGEDFEDVRTLQVRGGAGTAYGFGTLWSEFGTMTAIESLWRY